MFLMDFLDSWEPHFAWLPVETEDKGWRWLTLVYRRYIWRFDMYTYKVNP